MMTESEQIWYTWTNKGFGNPGFQIRAISRGFILSDIPVQIREAEGEGTREGEHGNDTILDLSGERIQTLLKYATYTLPPGTNAYELQPEQAPVSLAFVYTGHETILAHKSFAGIDESTGKTVLYFTHILTDLPPQTISQPMSLQTTQISPQPATQPLPEELSLPFTAREAINLWGSSSWKTVDTLAPDEKLLPRVTFSFAQNRVLPETALPEQPGHEAIQSISSESEFFTQGTLGRHTLKILQREYLEFLIQAFLMRQQGQHIYVAGDSATIARLIWGLAQSLPRTLAIMSDLTFSTYENIEKQAPSNVYRPSDELIQRPTIIGTCWHDIQGHELPLSHYQPDGVNGFALNCYTGRKTPLTPNRFTARFASYAVDCLLEENNHTFAELREILAQAEREQCKELYHFVRIYNAYQASLSPEDILYLLRSINENLEVIAENTMMLAADIARLRLPNVQKSIVYRIAENRYWWESSCLPELNAFYEFLVKYTSLPLPADIEPALESLQYAINELCERIAAQVNTAIRNNQEESMYFWSDMLEKTAPLQHTRSAWLALVRDIEVEDLNQPVYLLWWKIRGSSVLEELHQDNAVLNLHTPETPLNRFASLVANKIHVALQHNDTWALGDWSQTFTLAARPDSEAIAWLYLLQTLATSPYTPLYWDWWNNHGKQGVESLGQILQVEAEEIPQQLTLLCNSIVNNTVMIVRRANPATGIQGSGRHEWLFWHDVMSALMQPDTDYEPAHAAWLVLWGSLWPYVFYPAFVQWWHPRGIRIAQAICQFAEQHPQSDIANDLTAFIFETIIPLTRQQIEHMLEHDHTDREQEGNWNTYQHQLFLLLEILAVSIPQQAQVTVWATASSTPADTADDHADTAVESKGLIQELARTLQGEPVDELYEWEAQRFLLETWSAIPELQEIEIVAPWLNVSWAGLNNLLSTPYLPDSWKVYAASNTLATPIILQPHQVIALVRQHQDIIHSVLQNFLQQQEHAQQALDLFLYLIDFGYPDKPYLLSRLLLACLDQPEQVSLLMQKADLSPEETTILLEIYCAEIVAHLPWPAEISESIQAYLYDLDIDALTQSSTRAFIAQLMHVQQENEAHILPEISNAIIGWNSIRIFMAPGASVIDWLHNEAEQSQKLATVPLQKRQKLQENLARELVKVIRYETTILEIIQKLTPLYAMQEEEALFPPAHHLLRDLSIQAGTLFGHEQPPLRLLPYLKLVLIFAQELPGKRKDGYVDGCLHPLLLHVEAPEQERIDIHSELWFAEIQRDWQSHRQRQPMVHEEAVIANFRKQLSSGDVESITQAYQRFLRDVHYPATRIDAQERERAQLARDIVIAYNSHDQAMLLQAYQNVQNSPYQANIRYTPAILALINQLTGATPSVPATPALTPIVTPTPFPSLPTYHSYPGLAPLSDITEMKTIDQSDLLQKDSDTTTPSQPAEEPEVPVENMASQRDEEDYEGAVETAQHEEADQPEEQDSIIGSVLDEPITLAQLEQVNALKRLYLTFRIHHLEMRLKNLPAAEKKFYSYEIKDLEEQYRGSDLALRAYALDDLINDILIRHYIETLLEQDSKLSPTHFTLHPQIKAKFIAYDPASYQAISEEHQIDEQESEEVLSLFRRRELLMHYLFQKYQKTVFDQLDRWLAEEKQQQHNQIIIDQELAGLRPGKRQTQQLQQRQRTRGGFLSTLRRRS